jgi:hypothetical protein
MAGVGQESLEIVMIDFFGALRRGDFDAAAALLDPDVTWQGPHEDWVCHGREDVKGVKTPIRRWAWIRQCLAALCPLRWIRDGVVLIVSLAVRGRGCVLSICFTRARKYQQRLKGEELSAVRALARLAVSGRCSSLGLPCLRCCFEAARSGSTGRVLQGRGTGAVAAPALGSGSPATAPACTDSW